MRIGISRLIIRVLQELGWTYNRCLHSFECGDDMPASISPLVAELVPLFRQLSRGEYGIALGGAHAKGVADAESDLDIYVFARQVLPIPERERLCAQFSPLISQVTCWDEQPPEGSSAYIQGGTDFYYQGQKVEVWQRSMDYVSRIIADCQAGSIRRDCVTWTVMGFFNYCTLSDLDKMQPVED